MLKKAVFLSVFLGLPFIFPAYAFASEAKPADALRTTDANASKPNSADGASWSREAGQWAASPEKECKGTSVEDFLKGKCNKLNGYDVRPFELKAPQPFKDAGGHSWRIYGDEGTTVIPPFFEFQKNGGKLPPAWGADEFVRTDGFTQSGAPYQRVNPLERIDKPNMDNFQLNRFPNRQEEMKPAK